MPRRTTILDQLPKAYHNCAAAGPATGRWPDKDWLLGAIRMTGRGSPPFQPLVGVAWEGHSDLAGGG